jgi:F-type H+-transporting ATPase subunit a
MSGSPLTQFEVKKLITLPSFFGWNIDISNSTLFMILALVCSMIFLYIGTKNLQIKPISKMQVAMEGIYGFLSKMMDDAIKNQESIRFFPLVFTFFMFVITCNLLGMLPYGFTVTSHIIVTFSMAVFILSLITIYGIARNGFGFFKIFLPSGTPLWLSPLVSFIEIFAYLARSVSLSLRLSANMIAGHTMLKVIASLVIGAGLISIFPFLFVIIITAFEFFVAVLQAYIFAMLICVYIENIYSAGSH